MKVSVLTWSNTVAGIGSFALDSIPATFGVTSQTFVLVTANAFALLGLRAPYFMLKGLLDTLIYLSLGLCFILMFIGIKLIATYLQEILHAVPKIPAVGSLGIIGFILLVLTIASLAKNKSDPLAKAHAGRVSLSEKEEE